MHFVCKKNQNYNDNSFRKIGLAYELLKSIFLTSKLYRIRPMHILRSSSYLSKNLLQKILNSFFLSGDTGENNWDLI